MASQQRTPMKNLRTSLLALLGLLAAASSFAGGTLTPVGSADQPIQIRSHQVNVVINNGFAQTEVLQTFFNPNGKDLEAIYAFPVPKSASLSEVTIITGERTLEGEVLPKKDAEAAYEDEKAQGNDTGLAKKNSYQTYEFRVHPVRANAEIKLRFVYYQPLEIDTGVGRFLYPLEDGGTDEGAGFWNGNTVAGGHFHLQATIKSACG